MDDVVNRMARELVDAHCRRSRGRPACGGLPGTRARGGLRDAGVARSGRGFHESFGRDAGSCRHTCARSRGAAGP